MIRTLRRRLAVRRRTRELREVVRDVRAGRTSATDDAAYLTICARAARDPETFAVFKSLPAYTRVLEHLDCQHGRAYLDVIRERHPWILERLDAFRRNDELGSPLVCDYGVYGACSPTTLRYAKVLGDLIHLFGPLDGMRIIEIGAGYGGQCFIVSTASSPASYTLVDLEPPLALQRTYLDRLGVAAQTLSADELPADGAWDLVISNYAFSECTGRVQRHYLDRVLSRAQRGYLTMNWITPRHYRSLTHEQLTEALPYAEWLPEEPLTKPGNEVLVWGRS